MRNIGEKATNALRIRQRRKRGPPPWSLLMLCAVMVTKLPNAVVKGSGFDDFLYADRSDCSGTLLEGTKVYLKAIGVTLEIPDNFWADCPNRFLFNPRFKCFVGGKHFISCICVMLTHGRSKSIDHSQN
jgi:hypothetical protein